ncbi:hypothetical protein TEQG_08769 [Trichophyton equinum CBS 127.97]|uniref:Uncharacterized protein n=1 Tax=Trichophyton equinum (strain ATCC MYA-4606 / CBS 127.97) TaxID=559882 RepID=F2Q130_TRIEC|nr:hypothetical protein TEQG_08769 [Trichophyton equinum CBS 127.97]
MREEKDLPCPSEEVTYLNSIVMPDPEDEDGDESGEV